MSTTLELIQDFLAQKRIAFIGVSRDKSDFSRGLFRELCNQGYDVVPVNPEAPEIEGRFCFAQVQSIVPPVDGALLMTSPELTDRVVRDCAEAGITRVWLYRGLGAGAVSDSAIGFCQANGITVVPGFCPYMFLPKTPLVHRAHGFVMKLSGGYPE
ncbi:MAG: CoA-binding protein [Anaerolineae bacterium]|nr:CoA-binding protein [Anaerolineae bacterium]